MVGCPHRPSSGEALAAEGVRSAETRAVTARSGRGYLVSWLYPRDRIADDVLRNASADQRDGMLLAVIDAIDAAVSPRRLGVDPHIANWAIDDDGTPVLIDVGTPMMRTADGRGPSRSLGGRGGRLRASARPACGRSPAACSTRITTCTGRSPISVSTCRRPGWRRPVRRSCDSPTSASPRRVPSRSSRSGWRRPTDVTRGSRIFLQGVRRVDRTWQRRVRRRSYGWLLPPKIDRHRA